MGGQEHKTTIEQAMALWNAHDDRYFDVYAPDAPIHGFPPDMPPTVDGIRGLFGQMWSSFPDMRVDAEQLVAEGDVVAVNIRITGTHEGEFMGAPPTGNRIEVNAMSFIRFREDGKIAERWTRLDDVAFLTQLGLMPAAAGAPA